jgi:predicted MFS family arabinose efflux permease
VDANDAGWGSAQTLGLGALSFALIGAFYVIERRSKAPLMPFPGIFRIRTITGINVSAVLIAAALFSMFFFISLYMQQVLGYSALEAGLAYLPLAVGIIITAGATAGLVTRFGFKPVLVAGLFVTAAGLLWFTQVDVGGSYLSDLLGPMLLAAVGLGLAFVSMTVAAVSGVEAHEAGLASGLINTSQQIGGALGLAILATVANSRTSDALTEGQQMPSALTEGFQAAFAVGAGLAIAGAILAMLLVSSRASREHAEAARRGELEPAAMAA